METVNAVPCGERLSLTMSGSASCRQRSSVSVRQMRPRAWVAMKLIDSGVTKSAARTRSPSFSRSSASTSTTIRPWRISSMISEVGLIFTSSSPSRAPILPDWARRRPPATHPGPGPSIISGVALRQDERAGMMVLSQGRDPETRHEEKPMDRHPKLEPPFVPAPAAGAAIAAALLLLAPAPASAAERSPAPKSRKPIAPDATRPAPPARRKSATGTPGRQDSPWASTSWSCRPSAATAECRLAAEWRTSPMPSFVTPCSTSSIPPERRKRRRRARSPPCLPARARTAPRWTDWTSTSGSSRPHGCATTLPARRRRRCTAESPAEGAITT